MAAYATPKKDSYIVKKEYAEQIVQSKRTDLERNEIKKAAMRFQTQNLKKK